MAQSFGVLNSDINPPTPTEPAPGLNESSLPSAHLNTGEVSARLGEQERGIQPTYWEEFHKRLKMASEAQPLEVPFIGAEAPGWLDRWVVDRQMQKEAADRGSQKISPEEANHRYPGLPQPFTESVYPEVADFKASEVKRRQIQQDWVDRGGQVGWLGNLAVGALSNLNPASLVVQSAVGMGAGALGLAESFSHVFATNLAANLALDVPSYLRAKTELQNPSAWDTALGAFAGAGLMTGVHMGVVKPLRSRFFPKEVEASAARQAVDQIENGQKIDTSNLSENQTLREAGATSSENAPAPYRFFARQHPSESLHYQGQDATGGHVPFAPELGDSGIHAVDNPMVANHLAGPPEASFDGKMIPTEVTPESRFVNLDEPLPAPLIQQALSEFKKAGLAEGLITKDQLSQVPGREILKLLATLPTEGDTPRATEVMQARASGEGFDGYTYTHTLDGEPLHNGLYLFDQSKEKATLGESTPTDASKVPFDPAQERIARVKAAENPASQADYSPEQAQALQERAAQKPVVMEPKTTQPIHDEQIAQAEAVMKSLSEEDPSVAEELQRIRREDSLDEQEKNALKQLLDCNVKDVV